MKGSLPLPYIVALILGIAVIVIILFMFFTQSGVFTAAVDEKFCDARCLEFKLKCATNPALTWSTFNAKYPKCIDLVSCACS
jgi:hypothetical protein